MSALDAGELFVEFVAYQPHDGNNRAAQRYGAFVIDASRNLHWLDLGPAAPIDQSVRDLFEAANDWSTAVAGRENRTAQSAEQTAQDALRQLSKSVLAPLEPWLQRAAASASPRTAC